MSTSAMELLTRQELKSVESLIDCATESERLRLADLLETVETATGPRDSPSDLAKFVWGERWQEPPHIELLNDYLIKLARRDIKRLMFFLPPQHGKQIAHSVPVLTSNGWVPHGRLRPGDEVFSPNGTLVRVIAISEPTIATKEVHTTDGGRVKCHERHEWNVYDRRLGKWKLLETRDLVDCRVGVDGKRGGRWRYQLPLIKPLQGNCVAHPIDPYCLGAWLGDGTEGKACITHHRNDCAVVEAMQSNGMDITSKWTHATTGVVTTSFGEWYKVFRRFGCKRIPGSYLAASQWDRLQLLAGLIDTDGCIAHRTRRVCFSTASEVLAEDVACLVRTFGWRATIAEFSPRLSTSGIQGKKTVFQVTFSPDIDIPCRLPRKQNTEFGVVRRRIAITEVCDAEPEEGRCIQVEGGSYLVGEHLLPTHNSQLVSHFFAPWYLGRFPDHQVILASYGYTFASKWGRAARDVMREYGPSLFGVRVRDDVRSVDYWELADTEGSMATTGIGGAITGRRADVLIIDDPIKSAEEAVSEVYRDRLWDWWQSSASTRLSPDGVVILIQTRWHYDDLAGRLLSEEPGRWTVVSLPALAGPRDPLGRLEGDPLWPARYNTHWLQSVREGKSAFWWHALYQQEPSQHEAVLWPRHLFEDPQLRFQDWPQDLAKRVIALDPSAGGKGAKPGDYSAYVLLGADRACNLYVEADLDNVRGPREIVEHGVRHYQEFNPDLFGVESNASQELYRPLFADEFARCGLPAIEPEPLDNRVNKQLRISRLDEWFQSRMVHFRETEGTERLLAQLKEFPMGRHDDGPDALEMAVRLLAMSIGIPYERFAGTVG